MRKSISIGPLKMWDSKVNCNIQSHRTQSQQNTQLLGLSLRHEETLVFLSAFLTGCNKQTDISCSDLNLSVKRAMLHLHLGFSASWRCGCSFAFTDSDTSAAQQSPISI